MQSLLGVFCVSHMPNLGVVNIKKWRLNNVSESNNNIFTNVKNGGPIKISNLSMKKN
jgi:hypothetical protein